MSRVNCKSNRNIRIISSYVESLLGDAACLFEGLPFPEGRYTCAKDYLTNEDEWTTYEVFQTIFRRAKSLVGDPDFYFNCGVSAGWLHSWGRLSYFSQLFAGPNDGIRRLPFFNQNFNDTKDIDIIRPPTYDHKLKRIHAIVRVTFHEDQDPNRDYIGDPYLRGIISSIPTIWGLPPATVKQPLNAYDPEMLFKEEEEFACHGLDPRIEKNQLSVYCPVEKRRKVIGREVLLEPDIIGGRRVFLGRYSELTAEKRAGEQDKPVGVLITESLTIDGRTLIIKGEIFRAPCFVLDITYGRSRLWNRLFHRLAKRGEQGETTHGLIETINQLREAITAKNKAYEDLEAANLELKKAKEEIGTYARNLENMVEERTAELRKTQEELLLLNENLTRKVGEQVEELGRYNELRRYLSPKITERILSNGSDFGEISHRKLMTVLFSDIRGFSVLTDSLEPEEICLLLSNYVSEMAKLVHVHEGTLGKIIGDGIMVFFGDPVSIPDHAERAVRLAIDMQRKIDHLREEWLAYGHDLTIGIGINTGYMTVGNIGSEFHRDYGN